MTRSGRTRAAALVTSFALFYLPTFASAQSGLIGTECLRAVAVDGCSLTTVGMACAGVTPPSTCVAFVSGATACIPDDFAVFCCADDTSGCPLNEAGSPFTCVSGIGPLGQNLCLDLGRTYCNDGGPPTHADFSACQVVGGEIVAWADGDCDGDGIPNGSDDAPCPRPQATWVGDGCLSLLSDCVPGTSCFTNADGMGFCEGDPTTGQTMCVPDGPLVYCGGDLFLCPEGMVSIFDDERGQAFCAPAVCPEPSLSCIQSDGEFVLLEDGDCDGDGIPNGAEAEADICVPEGEPIPDGGSSGVDGGTTPADAGPGDINPRFGGGGGCACNTDPRSTPTPWVLALMLALGFAVRRRRS